VITDTRRTVFRVTALFVFGLGGYSLASCVSSVSSNSIFADTNNVSSGLHMPATKLAISGRPSSELADVAGLPSRQPLVSSQPFIYRGSAVDRENAASCLAAAAWYEAGNDRIGQKAVIQTVINRVKHPSFPNSVCGVVFQGSQSDTGCQFTFTCDGSLSRRRPTKAAWKKALVVAKQALNGAVDSSVGQATHYHANYVDPWWSGKLERLTTVGLHVFYRWPGSRGTLAMGGKMFGEENYASLVSKATDGSETALESLAGKNAEGQDSSSYNSQPDSDNLAATLRLSSARRQDPTIIMASTGRGESGRWAIAALNACQGKLDCQVLFYEDVQSVNRNRQLQSSNRERPIFLFVKDGSSKMVLKLWDCEKVDRPNVDQCLPNDAPALRGLMRDKSKPLNIASDAALQLSS